MKFNFQSIVAGATPVIKLVVETLVRQGYLTPMAQEEVESALNNYNGAKPVPVATAGRKRRGVAAGLVRVLPQAYDGWDGACPGCDLDAQRFAALCTEQGIEMEVLLNEQATRDGLVKACTAACAGMQAGDLLVVYVSGHGGQQRDTNGDEPDGLDETLCLYDGQMYDDIVGRWLDKVPAGVDVLFATDTCNSETIARYLPMNISAAVPQTFAAAVLHFGGCADGKSSYGGIGGGDFTNALLRAWQAGLSYSEWYARAKALMPRRQRPTYVSYGAAAAAFAQTAALL